MAAAMRAANAELGARHRARLADADPKTALTSLLDGYLSARHRDNPGNGCLLPALCAHAGQRGSPLKGDFAGAVESLERLLVEMLGAMKRPAPRSLARSMLAEMVGAMALARAVDDAALSDGILVASRAALKARAGLSQPSRRAGVARRQARTKDIR